MENNLIKSNEKYSKQQLLHLIDEIDRMKNEELKRDINAEFQKDFENIDWKKVTDCMQSIIIMRSDEYND